MGSQINEFGRPEGVNPLRHARTLAITVEAIEDKLLELLCAGESLSSASRVLKTSYQKVRAVAKQPEFQARVHEASRAAHERMMEAIKDSRAYLEDRLNDIVEKGLDELEDLIENAQSERVRLLATQDALDRHPLLSRKTNAAQQGGVAIPVNQMAVFLKVAAGAAVEIDERHINPSGNGPSLRITSGGEEEGSG